MAQSNIARTVANTIIAVNAVASTLLIMALVYLFFQISNLQEENRNLRNKWQKLEILHECDEKTVTDHKEKKNIKQNGKLRCGIKGKRGRPGVKGDPGNDGIGIPGKDGMKGEKGDQGICSGSCTQNLLQNKKDSPLIHMTGDGKQKIRIDNFEESAVSFWNVTYKTGDISYNKAEGMLTINVDGFYYMYSQMAYCGKKEARVGHTMKINDNEVLKSVTTAKYLGTHAVGGVFKLKKGDKIAISPTVTNLIYCFSKREAYFGAFLVHK